MSAAKATDLQTVTEVRHWSDSLFSFRCTRPASLRFRSGEFVMLGLPGDDGRPILRAYSITSPSWDDQLEFYSIKVPSGPLTSRLQHVEVGDQIILRPKPVGTLVLDALLPGKRVWMLATGTGIAPFASLIRDPDTYERFEQVILMHTCRRQEDLEYGRHLIEALENDPLIGEMVEGKLRYYPTTTREDSSYTGRITANLEGFRPDMAWRIPDAEALPILFDLAWQEGLVLGGSSAVNIAGAIRMARQMGPGHVIVTMLCDPGNRYATGLWNPAFLREKGLPVPGWMEGGRADLPDMRLSETDRPDAHA